MLYEVITLPHNEPGEDGQNMPATEVHPIRLLGFWTFAAIAVLYAFAEGTFSNWSVIYLHEVKHLPEMTAALALSLFWAAMAGGRLLVSALVARIPAQRVWLSLPLLMISAFLALSYNFV